MTVMRTSILQLFLLFNIGLIFGCGSDPYQGQKQNMLKLTSAKENTSNISYDLQVPAQLDLVVGEKLVFTIAATASLGLPPLVNVVELPEGAGFNPTSGKFIWKPEAAAAVDPLHPASGFRVYVLTAQALDGRDGTVRLQKSILIFVRKAAIENPTAAVGKGSR
jgi:hypothetical protein